MASPTLWGTEALWQRLERWLPGLSIEVVARCGSTSTELIERLRLQGRRSGEAYGRRADDLRPSLLVAEHQTGGRGRIGRSWKSDPQASLTFSLALPLDRADWSGLSLAVGVALAEALDPGGARIGLKWPNDLWLVDAPGTGRKLGGVLIEGLPLGQLRIAVIGIGLNVAPAEFGDLGSGYGCVQEIDAQATPPAVLARVMPPLAQALHQFQADGFAPFASRFAVRDLLRGRRVDVTPGGPSGRADGLADDGALVVVADDGTRHRVASGEVSVRVAAEGD